MTGIEQITKERLKQVAYYPDDSRYQKRELEDLALILQLGDNQMRRELVKKLIKHSGFDKTYLNKLISKTETDRLKIAGAFLAAAIDLQNQNK